MESSISQGRVLWLCLGPRGGYKNRPAVALSAPDANGDLYVVVGSTQRTGNQDREIDLPWSANGKSVTKIKEPTVVDVGWIEKIPESDVIAIGGCVPPKVLVKIQEAIRNLP